MTTMAATTIEPEKWSRRRLWIVAGLVMLGQLGVIFWLSRRDKAASTPPPGPSFQIAADRAAELPGLSDPTLFVRPNRLGFSGPAWLQVAPPEPPSLDWTEPPRWLGIPAAQLGGVLKEYIATNVIAPFDVLKRDESPLEPVAAFPATDPLPKGSTLRVEGEIASRPLLTPLTLAPQAVNDMILTNSEVQVAVTAEGKVFSAVLLKGCGSKEADKEALSLSWGAKFSPLSPRYRTTSPAGGLSWGRLVFQWQTVAQAASNNPAAASPDALVFPRPMEQAHEH